MSKGLTNLSIPLGITELVEEDDSGRKRRRAVFANGDDDDNLDDDEDMDDSDDDDMDEDDDDDDDDEEDDHNTPRRGRSLSKFDTRNIPRKGDTGADEDNGQETVEFAESDSDFGEDDDEDEMINVDGRRRTNDSGSEDDSAGLAGELRWKANLKEKASDMFHNHRRTNLMSLIYSNTDLTPEDIASGNYGDNRDGDDSDGDSSDDDDDDKEEEFFSLKTDPSKNTTQIMDSSKQQPTTELLDQWDDEEVGSLAVENMDSCQC